MGREGDRRQQQREERNEKQLQMVSALHVLLWVSRPPHGEEEWGVVRWLHSYVGHVDYVIC